jgi:Na+-driven multidrug efflux pump
MNNQIGAYAPLLEIPDATNLYIAIFGVVNRILIFVMMPLFAIMLGFQPIAGFNWGAEKYKRVRKVMKLSLITSVSIASFVYTLIMIFPEQIISIFNAEQVFVENGVLPLRLILMVLPLVGIQLLGSGLFVSIGKAIPALILSLSRQVLFLFPLLFILPRFYGLDGLWYAFPVADIVSISLAVILIITEFRKHPVEVEEVGDSVPEN